MHAAPATGQRLNGAASPMDLSADQDYTAFQEAARRGNLVPMFERIFADQLTPVTAYRCLVAEDDREAPSFLFESVVNGTQTVLALSTKSCLLAPLVPSAPTSLCVHARAAAVPPHVAFSAAAIIQHA